jgi:surfeit locus 1 family protein
MRPHYRRAASRLLVLLAALALCALGLRLGLWQLDRATQKEQLQAMLDMRQSLPPLGPADLAATPAAAEAQYHRRIELEGAWLHSATIYLDNRQMKARPGFFVLTPLLLDAAPRGGEARLVLVQRGWVARDNNDRTRLPDLPRPDTRVRVSGRIAPPPARLYEFDTIAAGPIRQNLELDAYARELGRPLLPFTVLQTAAPEEGPDGLSRDWLRPAAGTDKHLGYAFQWFALSALIAVFYAWFQLILPWRHRRRIA